MDVQRVSTAREVQRPQPRPRTENQPERREVQRRETPPDRGRVETRNSDGDRAEVSRGR